MRLSTVLGIALTISLASTAFGQRNKLSVGDAAPGLDIEKWVKGDEVSIAEGKTYIVEFWATWCGPCRKSIPHLSTLQKEYKDAGLTIIGVSSEESDTVEPFVRRQGDKMDYTVAVDRRNSTKRAWFDAARLQGIPAAFIVNAEGKIAHIGNPLADDFDATVRRVLDGRYNPKLEKEAKPVLTAARQARKVRNWRMAERHYEEVVKLDPRVFATIALEKFEMMLVDMGEKKEAYAYAREGLMNGHFVDDGEAMGMLAEMIVTDSRIPTEMRDLDFALDAARKGREIAGEHRGPPMLATIAMVQFHRGEIDEAIEAQKRAYFLASRTEKGEYRRVLKTYQQAGGRLER